jgi:hypothetical protein
MLNPNAVSGNVGAAASVLGLSPIMPSTPTVAAAAGSASCGGCDFAGAPRHAAVPMQQQPVNAAAAAAAAAAARPSQSADAADSAVNTSTASSAASTATKAASTAGAAAARSGRRYTHNPYSASNAANSSRASSSSSTCSADNSAPATPNNGSFSAPPAGAAAASMAAAGSAYGGAGAVAGMNPALAMFMLPSSSSSSTASGMSASGMMPMTLSTSALAAAAQMAQMAPMASAMDGFAGTMVPGSFGAPQRGNSFRRNSSQPQYNSNGGGVGAMPMFGAPANAMMAQPMHMQPQHVMQQATPSPTYSSGTLSPLAPGSGDIVMYPGGAVQSLKSATEQFEAMRGSLAAAACSQRGRHALVAIIRLQQPEHADALLAELVPAWGALVADMNGCHVARTIVECLPSARIAELCAALPRDVVMTMCAASQYSRRVLQSMFENHRADALHAVVEHIVSGAVALSTTQQGCISVMRVFEFAMPVQRQQLMAVLAPHLAALAMDPYGNYVVQTISQSLAVEDACATLEMSFAGSWVPLSCNKFASNVVEKLIRIATPAVRRTIVEELCGNQANLAVIIVDGFGNFVLQALIDSCTNPHEFRRISDRVRPMLASSPYGHKIEGKLKMKRFAGYPSSGAASSSGSSRSSSTGFE